MFDYDFGPNVDFNIRFVGEMEQYNGSYESKDSQSQYLVQVLCHAIYQIKKDICKNKISPDQSILYLSDIYFHWIRETNSYAVYGRNGMTVMVVYETGFHSFDFEFLSPNQLERYGDTLLDYACQHVLTYGRPT